MRYSWAVVNTFLADTLCMSEKIKYVEWATRYTEIMLIYLIHNGILFTERMYLFM